MRILRATVALLTAAVVLVPLSLARADVSPCPGVQSQLGWTLIAAPNFPSGPPALTAYAVNPLHPERMFATNGVSVMATFDFGCDWEERFALNDLPSLEVPVSAQNSEIVDIDIPEHSSATNRVFVTVVERVGGVGLRPHVFESAAFGDGWKAIDEGLQLAVGEPLGLHVSPSSPNFMYLHLRSPAVGTDQLWATVDGGANWERRTGPQQGIVAADMAIDPLAANDLWFWGGGGLYRSHNGGVTRTLIDALPANIPMVDVSHFAGRQAQIFAYEPEGFTFFVSLDNGGTWNPVRSPLPGNPLSITHGSAPNDIFFSQHQGIWRYVGGGVWVDLTPPGYTDLFDLSADRASSPSIYARTPNLIVKYSVPKDPGLGGPLGLPDVVSTAAPPSLMPKKVEIKLKPSQTRSINYKLDIPGEGTPLDVFFLVDTSNSQDPSIAGLRTGMQKIIKELNESGIDVQFGVGEIKDYPIPGYGDAQQNDFPYRLDREIGPVDASLSAALQRLEASGGGALDQPESQLTGLYQAATGAGDPGFVPAGQEAGFRREALKVIVNITDAPFHKEPQHPSPPFEQVATALHDKHILQVGLAVFGPNGADGLNDLVDMAEATDTVAPTGVDCDDNGSIDLPAGDPLVCEVTDDDYDGSLTLAPAIVATLEAITDEVRVELAPSDGEELIDVVDPELVSAVNLKENSEVPFDVTYDCPRSMFGKTRDVTLVARVRGEIVATSEARITCKPPPPSRRKKKEKIPPQLLGPAAVPLAILLVGPPPPPPPATENISATQNAAQAQGAMATEQQEQVEVAVARQSGQRFQTMREESYSFSAYKQNSPEGAPVALYLSAAALAAAYGAIATVRTKARTALARNRR